MRTSKAECSWIRDNHYAHFAICDAWIPSYIPAPVVEGQHFCMREHTLRPHDCRSASEKRKPDCPPFNLVKGQKKERKHQYDSTACPFMDLGKFCCCLAARSTFSYYFFLCTAEYCVATSTGWLVCRWTSWCWIASDFGVNCILGVVLIHLCHCFSDIYLISDFIPPFPQLQGNNIKEFFQLVEEFVNMIGTQMSGFQDIYEVTENLGEPFLNILNNM